MVTEIKHESKVERRMPPSLAVGFPLPPWPQRLNLLALKFRLMLCGCLGLTTWSPAEPLNFVATNLWTAEVGYYNQSSPAQDTNGVLYVTAWSGWLLPEPAHGATKPAGAGWADAVAGFASPCRGEAWRPGAPGRHR